jgi:hypothetical protein
MLIFLVSSLVWEIILLSNQMAFNNSRLSV